MVPKIDISLSYISPSGEKCSDYETSFYEHYSIWKYNRFVQTCEPWHEACSTNLTQIERALNLKNIAFKSRKVILNALCAQGPLSRKIFGVKELGGSIKFQTLEQTDKGDNLSIACALTKGPRQRQYQRAGASMIAPCIHTTTNCQQFKSREIFWRNFI